MKNKRGLSDIMAVSLIILVSVTATTFLFMTLNEATLQLEPAANCALLSLEVPKLLTIKEACLLGNEESLSVTLERSHTSSDFSTIGFSISGDGPSAEFICGSTCGYCPIPSPGTLENYNLDLESMINPEFLTISVDGCAIDSIENFPLCTNDS